MNLVVLPAMIGALVAGYIAIATRDYNNGQEKIYVTDSMIRHHELAIGQRTRLTNPTLGQDIPVTSALFQDALAWNSALAIDTQQRLWLLTFIGPNQIVGDTTINDAAIAGIQFELATKNYEGGTFGRWNLLNPGAGGLSNPFLDSTIGAIEFAVANAPQIADGVPVIATYLSDSCTITSATQFACSGSFVR